MGIKFQKNISSVKRRILEYIDFKLIKKNDFLKKIKLSATNFHGKNAKSELGGDKIFEILRCFPEISPEWLITGRGNIIRKLRDEKLINVEKHINENTLFQGKEIKIEKSRNQNNFSFSVRLNSILKNYKVSGYKLSKEFNLAESTISNYRSGKSFPASEFLIKLGEKYENLNLNWLITGDGHMLREKESHKQNEDSPKILRELSHEEFINSHNHSKKEIELLKERLVEKDKHIDDIKSSLERQVASLQSNMDIIIKAKDELLKAREEVLRNKDEVIAIQKQHIKELSRKKIKSSILATSLPLNK
ncbi:helix-turn-helix domain-containing protein [Bacteroidetes bacterium endosymbiont of Geopemphigus sp.]|uniref:helix-turn-helix domain-containing protein n=1 Tax=Bacteroidetes bacterium endosymbiont of Geopemphigus sp. TaxID=2047937 RepID=UPI000CD0C1C1|nr:helix-turn-helix domain-containing protein [Bacteroidetes bacterium endosymbiont of Geopemphigus sp.]